MDTNDWKKRPRRSERVENLKKLKCTSSPPQPDKPRKIKPDRPKKVEPDKSNEILSNESNSYCTTHILCLPDEIYEKIFSYLGINDRLSASLVCRKWQVLLNCPLFLEDIHVCIGKDVKVGKECSYFTRKFSDFEFVDVQITLDFLTFLTKCGKTLKKLTFTRCEMDETPIQLSKKTYRCSENLVALHFNQCYVNLFHYLPKLEEFVIHGKNAINLHSTQFLQEHLSVLDNTMPNLKILRLNLDYCLFICFSPWSVLSDCGADENPNECLHCQDELECCMDPISLEKRERLKAATLVRFVEKRKNTMEEVEVGVFYEFRSSFYKQLLRVDGMKLKKLEINRNDSHASPEYIKTACRKMSTLTEIDFSNYSSLKDDVLSYICSVLPGLESLVITGRLDTSIADVFQLEHLRSLTFNKCRALYSSSFANALTLFQSNKLTSFTIVETVILDGILRSLLEKMPELRHLHISFNLNPPTTITKLTVQSICRNLVHLQSLELVNGNVSNDGLFCPDDPEMRVTHLKGLKTLKLKRTRLSPKKILDNIAFLELRTLVLDALKEDSPISAEFYKDQLKRQNPSLKCLELECPLNALFNPLSFQEMYWNVSSDYFEY